MGAAKYKVIAIFWGSFDLGVTRFSGRKASLFTPSGAVPNMPAAVELDAYSDAVSSAGFWPDGQGVDLSLPKTISARSDGEVRPAQH
jgi:Family of unknown function (DUF5996)